ncbi:butyrophilin subfamily 2 member A2-like isoform X2 [Micropterus salmoides]|uniref:butyrophilin subfamily 2 member A2-like isoform X2 n=1 Tax=Micropterus salmoides TaxID=27706 RepID=UPI0018EB10DE|nr:butyrophilin subfamily 2 member A2-like isoform X2 [Micropterus salmoides]
MFNVKMASTTNFMKFLPLVCLLARSGQTFGDEQGSGDVRVVVKEGSDAILPCSLSNKENAESKLFDWKKDGPKEIFFYDGGLHYNNGRPGQDQQFKGRVSHFQDELKYGNASIIIRNTTVADSGDYTCDFQLLQPRQIFNIKLVVGGASPEPYVKILNQTQDVALLQCEVRGASPKPTVEWQDSAGNKLPAEEPQVSERGGSFYIILQTTVMKTDNYRCVATQEEIKHQIHTETYLYIGEKLFEDTCSRGDVTGWFGGIVLGAVILAAVLASLVATKRITVRCNKGATEEREETWERDMMTLSRASEPV